MLRDGSSLDSLCDRLDAVLQAINACLDAYGEQRVIGELDAAAATCDGACQFRVAVGGDVA